MHNKQQMQQQPQPHLQFHIHPDIQQAHTLPASFYTDPTVFNLCKEKIFATSWQFIGDERDVRTPGQALPLLILESYLDEPVVLIRDTNDQLRCLSNVCTHRGNLIVESPAMLRHLRCRYHGRRFSLNGTCEYMPEFEGVAGFPSEKDNLPQVPFATWRGLLFASITPSQAFEQIIAPIESRVGHLPIEEFTFDPSLSTHYLVKANWALYCDNYLEGFHIPFVHSGLAATLSYDDYTTELFDNVSLQVGIAKPGEPCLNIPDTSVDHGRAVAAYYFFIFPNTMLNFYPWGLSINVVRPLEPDLTRVSFLAYVWDKSKVNVGAGACLDRVEREDEAVVESVQLGVRSRFYDRGRYSPTREQGVHHFHRLLAHFLSKNDSQ